MFEHKDVTVQPNPILEQIVALKKEVTDLQTKSCQLYEVNRLQEKYRTLAELEKQSGDQYQATFSEAMHICYHAVYQYMNTNKITVGVPQAWLKKLHGKEITMSDGTLITINLTNNDPNRIPIILIDVDDESPQAAMP